ncbi:MAG: hypothetical protein ACTHKZ_00720 [Lysobacteraceae bacterium]
MRSLLVTVLCAGLALPAFARPPEAPLPPPAQAPSPSPRSPIGTAMAHLSRALHDAAEQARRPVAATPAPDADPVSASRPPTAPSPPQPTEQAALP